MNEHLLSDDPVPQELLDIQAKLSEWNTHKVYFDNETGEIFAISNEDLPEYQYFFNIPSESVSLLENERIDNYKVSFDSNANPHIILKPKQDESNLFLTKIDDYIDNNPELIVEKNIKTKNWTFFLRFDKRQTYLKMGVNSRLEFFVVEKDNKNILIRKMNISLKTLCEDEQITIPFVSYREADNNAEIYIKKFFTSMGLKIIYVK